MLSFDLRTASSAVPALYAAVPDTSDGANRLYYLASQAGDARLTLRQVWALHGAFVISPASIDLAGFTAAELSKLATSLSIFQPGAGPAAIAWLSGTREPYSIALRANPADGTATIGIQTTIPVGPAALQIAPSKLQIGTGATAALALSPSALTVFLAQQYGLAANTAKIMLDGPAIGAFTLAVADTSLFNIFAFCNPQFGDSGQTVANGPDIRIYLAPQSGGSVTELRFPVFAPAAQSPGQNGYNPPSFTLTMMLDPIWPFDPGRTVMIPDLGVAGVPELFCPPLFTTTAGAPITLTATAVSFYFGQNNGGGYVAPAGSFTIGHFGDATAPLSLLCGLLAQEHLLVHPGDTLTLLPSPFPAGFPALVIGSAKIAAEAAMVTTSPLVSGAFFTTSWLQYTPAAGKSGAYFAQPQPSVSFSSGVLQTSVTAVASQLGSLQSASPPIPMTCYAAAYPPPIYNGSGQGPPGWPVGGTQNPADVGATWPNGVVDAVTFSQAEHFGLAPMRYRKLFGGLSRAGALDPIFHVSAATRGQAATAATQQGFVVQLNPQPNAIAAGMPSQPPEGSWNNIVLASYQGQKIALAPPAPAQVLDAHLVTTLLANQLFMVADKVPLAPAGSPAAEVTKAISGMEVGGFSFVLNAAILNAQPGDQQIIVFKFNNALSLNDLIDQTAHWNTAYLQADAAAAQSTLREAVATAKQAMNNSTNPTVKALFVDFVTRILVEPNWTGVIAFNCAIDASQMPPSLAILIAAAAGQRITAHHFGIEISRVGQQGQQVSIKQSSLFGVIAYDAQAQPPPPVPPDFAFWTQMLHVGIHNSSVTQFQAAIEVALNMPFGRSANCPPKNNAVTLTGAYQQQGKLGTVVFSEANPDQAVYTFRQGKGLRVLDQLAIRSATLLAGKQTTDHGVTTIPGRIVLGGALLFIANPFFATDPAEALDLFGYGTGTGAAAAGLDFTGFTLDVKATIEADDTAGATNATADYSGIKLSANSAALRSGSLVYGLPCQVDAFLANTTNGLSADSLQAQAVHVVQLENISVPAPLNPLYKIPLPKAPSVTMTDPPAHTAQTNFTTPTPHFAVTFDLPLGSLGGLSDVHASLDTSLILGWGPNPATPDDDAAAVMIKLPFASVGYGGFNLQGVLKTVFGDANLMQVKTVANEPYIILFNNVQLSVFGFKLPPHVLSDLILFVPGGKPGPMGMCLMAKQTKQT